MYLMLRTVRVQLRQLRGAGGGRVSFRFVSCVFYVYDFWTYLGNWWPHRRSSGRHPNRRQLPEWQRCKHREEQTEITDYIRDEQKPTKVAIDYGIQGNSPGPATATATRAKISNKLCKKLYWPWATFQLKMAEAKTSGQTERKRERSRWADRRADSKTDRRTDRQADRQTDRTDMQTVRPQSKEQRHDDCTQV